MRPTIYVTDLGLSDYDQALRIQYEIHRRCQLTGENMLVLTQHYPVVTLGYRRIREHLRCSQMELEEKGIMIAEVERGGGATYHGPGQLVMYPIFSSLLRSRGVRGFIACLEDVMCAISLSFGVIAERRPGFPGIWVGERKLGAVGIAVRRGVSLHGCALNVNLDLRPFSYIVPCGLAGVGVTSVERENGVLIPMLEVARRTRQVFAAVFATSVEEMPDEWCRSERETRTGPLDYPQPTRAEKCA